MKGAHLANFFMQALRLAGYALIFLGGIWFHASGAMPRWVNMPRTSVT